MKIFILAFCIFQICLAQSNVIEIVPPVQTLAYHINDGFKAALAASQILAAQVKFVIDKNGQLPEVVIGPAIRYFYFLSELLSKLKGFPKYAKLSKALEKFLNAAKSVPGGLGTAGITLETIAAFVTYNIISDVMNGLNAIANLNSDFTPTVIPKALLPADFKVHAISNETSTQLSHDYRKFSLAYEALFHHRNLFVNNFDSFGQSIPSYMHIFAANTVDGLAKMIDPVLSEMIKNSVGTLKTQLVDVVTYIVNNGTPLGEVIWDIIQIGAASILTSYGQLVKAAQP